MCRKGYPRERRSWRAGCNSSCPRSFIRVRVSLPFRGVVIALACVFLGYGPNALSQANNDVFPEVASPQADIQTEAPGTGTGDIPGLTVNRGRGLV